MYVSMNIYSEYFIAFSHIHTTPKNAIQSFEIIVLYYVNSLQMSDKETYLKGKCRYLLGRNE